jgi:rhodanese-related sulfurtransferase
MENPMNETATNYIEVNDVDRLLKEDSTVVLIDARTAEEFAGAHVPGAINVPITDLAEYTQRPRNAAQECVITMCGSTGRGEKAASILRAHGMANIQVMKGGLKAWREAGFPVA